MSLAMEDTNPTSTGQHSSDAGTSKSSIGQPGFYRIARSGARPLKFSGSELAMAMSFTPEIPFWYEINLYRTTDSEFVAAVRLFFQSEDRSDTIEAWSFETLEEALAAIEHYDAATDVEFPVFGPGEEPCGAEVAARALELRARIHAQRQHYRGLVGEILHELDAS